MIEKANAHDAAAAAVGLSAGVSESMRARGIYSAVCRGFKAEHEAEYLSHWPRLIALREIRDRAIDGTRRLTSRALRKALDELADFERFMETLTEIKWADVAPNTVVTVGKNHMLDNHLAGSSYSVTGPYMGLISSTSYSAIAAADTMASHAGWLEGGTANAPTYTSPRKTISWSSASSGSKAPSSAPVFSITGTGTVKGVFMLLGTGAVSTIDNTSGTLFSAGLFSGGDQAVVNTNTLTITYSVAL